MPFLYSIMPSSPGRMSSSPAISTEPTTSSPRLAFCPERCFRAAHGWPSSLNSSAGPWHKWLFAAREKGDREWPAVFGHDLLVEPSCLVEVGREGRMRPPLHTGAACPILHAPPAP